MSKRHGATSIAEYRSEGFIAPGVINYLALLGWNPGTPQEIFTLAELIPAFDLAQTQKGGAVFDREKFLWFNREHLRRLSDAELTDMVMDVIPENLRAEATNKSIARILPLIRERAYTLHDIETGVVDGEFSFLFSIPTYDRELLKFKKDPDVNAALPRLETIQTLLQSVSDFPSVEEAKAALWDYAESVGRGEVLWPLRIALTGKERSADPFTVISCIGREETQKRISAACATIQNT
jgi:glutamyl/glutaminyl-tRNA synthetase